MLLVIFAVLLLLFYQTMLPGALLTRQIGAKGQMGPRDDLPEPTQDLSRARRALANLQETLPIFLTLAVLTIIYGTQGGLALVGGWLYFAARVAHVVCYMRKLSPWRSIAYAVSLVALILMAIPFVPSLIGGGP